MALFESEQAFPGSREEIFEYFLSPHKLIKTAPPDFQMELLHAPVQLAPGEQLIIQAKRWGIPYKVTHAVVAVEAPTLIVVEQKEGPFGRWHHTQHFEEQGTGCLVRDRIEYEPPGGMIGMFLKEATIGKDLEETFAYRRQKLEELHGKPSS